METTKISVLSYGKTASVEFNHSDTTIDEMMESYIDILVTIGWAKETVNDWIVEYANGI